MHKGKVIQNAKKYVNKLLLPLNEHYYHSYGHALDVMQRAEYLSKKEGLSQEDIEMMSLTGLFHDTGFIIQYDKNEPIGAKIARNYLMSILYPEERIQIIEKTILATDPDYKVPQNIYEEIIKDADMDNLGRDDFLDKNTKLKREIEQIKDIKIKDPDWIHASVELLKDYKYRTKSQITERNRKKTENLESMIKELDDDSTI